MNDDAVTSILSQHLKIIKNQAKIIENLKEQNADLIVPSRQKQREEQRKEEWRKL